MTLLARVVVHIAFPVVAAVAAASGPSHVSTSDTHISPTREDAIRAGISGDQEILFWRAIRTHSDQAPFVLVSAAQPDGHVETYAISGALLLGAIHLEHDLPYTAAGEQRAEAIALAASGQRFHFTKAAARKNIPRYYDTRVLVEMREALARYSRAELISGFAPRGQLHALYSRYPHPAAHGYEHAVAHVLLDRGLLPSMHSFIRVEE